jgi:hypothetical protein
VGGDPVGHAQRTGEKRSFRILDQHEAAGDERGKAGLDLTVVATASGALTLNASWAAPQAPGVVFSSLSSYDLRFLNVAQPGTPITSSAESTQNATAPANFMLPPNAYELTLTSRLATSELTSTGR